MRTDIDRRPIVVKAMEKASAETRFGRLSTETESATKAISNNAALTRWFKERRLEMTGRCKHCGGKTSKEDDGFYKHCIAHILPKAFFPSVATHHSNWIELCFWNNSCHTNFDNYSLDITELNCFDEVINKFVEMYPIIDKKERRRIPNILLNYVNIDI